MINPVLPVYNRSKIKISHGQGAYLYDTDNNKYLDFVSGVAVNCLGHCHPKLVNALKNQADKLWQISNLYQIPGMNKLANILTDNCFADTVFFCNSGAESLECTIKMVRKYHDATGNPDKYKIITFTGAFHGRTLATIWASKRDQMMQDGFGPPVDGFVNVEFDNIDAVKNAIDEETAAILIEPIQGDGGIRPASAEYLQELRKIADNNGLLLCFDEVQCGMGRVGSLYAHQELGVTPDILASAKGIGGGFPLGACLATEKAAQGMTIGTHGSTYGGNPMAMAVGYAVVEEILSDGFLDNVNEKGKFLSNELNSLKDKHNNIIEEIRGYGLLQGIKVKTNNKDIISKLENAGLLTAAAAENVIRIIPPLNIEKEQIKSAINILDQVLSKER